MIKAEFAHTDIIAASRHTIKSPVGGPTKGYRSNIYQWVA